jgi:hypothetical protein
MWSNLKKKRIVKVPNTETVDTGSFESEKEAD